MDVRTESDGPEITQAAICAYGRLLCAVGRRLLLHPTADGGVICEDRACPAHPRLWRVSQDGTITPDAPYSFRLRAFAA